MKTYCINFQYEGIMTGECGIVPINVRANTSKEAVQVLIENQKAQGYKVLAINAVYQRIRQPKGGWLKNPETKENET